MTGPTTAQEAARSAAEAIRALNHQTRPGTALLDVTDLYDMLGELALMVHRLPQLLRQIEDVLDDMVEHEQVVIVDGPNLGDTVAAAAIVGHWLTVARAAADQLGHRLDQAHEILAYAAVTDTASHRPSSS